MTKQTQRIEKGASRVRNVSQYAKARLGYRSEHAKQTSQMLAAFAKAYEVKQ